MALPPGLFGAWRLLAFEDRDDENAEWSASLGADARGLLIVHRPALISVHIQAPSPPGSDEPVYVGYFGAIAVREVEDGGDRVTGTMLLDLDGGHPPEALGGDEPRPFELAGDELVLGDQRTWRRRVERIAS